MIRRHSVKLLTPLFVILLVVALAACVRTLPREDGGTDTTATTEPLIMPTAVPLDTPIPESTAVIDAGSEPGAESTPEGQPAEAGTATPEPTTDTTATETGANPGTYTVQSGDTLGGIAEQFNITLEELAAANGITNIDALDVGQVLTIPAAGAVDNATNEPPPASSTEEQTHVVKAGENLFRISLAYDISVDELAAYNGITDPDQIEVGQVLKIPPGK